MVLQRVLAWVVSASLCGLSLMPLLGLQQRDSFPISTYPMFAARRGQPTLTKLVAAFADGKLQPVPPEWVADGELLQAKVLIQRAVQAGPSALRDLCEGVARKLRADPFFGAAQELQVQAVRYDAIDYFVGSRTPTFSKVVARCPLPRAAEGK